MAVVRKTIRIEGMSCGHCVMAVRDALEQLDGIRVDTVDIGMATLELNDNESNLHDVARAITEAGYTLIEA